MKVNRIFSNAVIRNASWIVGVNIVQSALAFILSMLTARYLGPSNYGLIGYAQSVVAFVAPISLLGFANVMVQELVNHPEDEGKIVGSAILTSSLSSVLCMIGAISFCAIANSGEYITIAVCALYSIWLLTQSFTLIIFWFQAKLLSKYSSIAVFFAYIIVSAYKIYLLACGKSVYLFALSNVFDHFLLSVILILVYIKLGGKRISFSAEVAKRMFSRSKYYIVTNMMVAVFAQTGRIMLKIMISDAATGFYSAAAYCAECTGFVFSAITDSARPSIFASKKISTEKFEEKMSSLYCIVMYLGLAQSILMTVFAPLIVRVLYGTDYIPAVPILRLVVWSITFSQIGVIRNIWVLAEERHKWLWIINLSGALANVVLNYFLIPSFGAMGAAFASLFTQFFANVVVSYLIKPIRRNTTLMIRGWDFRLITGMLR